ncbi:MAG: LPS export ABC transporter periplasmic protein LptC [Gammaproteobacteria bacterium]|jgi:lipopolysaccharide export system protein LptC|nr:LPS export ABC transporter periplasmic protein LptC [Chromatiales bacterium]MDP6673267.1 LPS export ABC transporter periplasmic protein LptC [Gammaproteobacteria bacterium]
MIANPWPKLVLLLIAAVASGVLVIRSGEQESDRKQRPELGVGYSMKQAELIRTGESGQVLYRVQTNQAKQVAENGIIELDVVRIKYDPPTEIPWDLHADTGHILPGGNIIKLTGNVIAKTRGEMQAPTRISTDYLELNTETYIANTDRDVVIDYTNNTLFAKGLRAYLKEERLQLISDVNGQFIP